MRMQYQIAKFGLQCRDYKVRGLKIWYGHFGADKELGEMSELKKGRHRIFRCRIVN